MSNSRGPERAAYVQDIFTRIARRYDLMNRLMTGGQDVHWRDQVIRLADLSPGARLLDIGAGTGDLARTAARQYPGVRVAAADFTLAMMKIGRRKGNLPFLAADALALPFVEAAFDAVVSGFLLRNVTDLRQSLREQHRVLKEGGRIVVLDTTRPGRNLLSPLIRIHMHTVIPLLGRLLSGTEEPYRYLPDSTEQFLTAEQLAEEIAAAGFREISFKRSMFGTIAIHRGIK